MKSNIYTCIILSKCSRNCAKYLVPAECKGVNILNIFLFQKCLIRDPKVRPSIEELLEHPYLKSEKKEGKNKNNEFFLNCDWKFWPITIFFRVYLTFVYSANSPLSKGDWHKKVFVWNNHVKYTLGSKEESPAENHIEMKGFC